MLRAGTTHMPPWLQELLPILVLLAVIAAVISRLPKVDLGHSPAYIRRRVTNWLPVGLTYAFLYMARYNLNSIIGPVFEKSQFSSIYAWGTLAYGVSFVINGPLTDRFGGKATILAAALGAALVNVVMGVMVTGVTPQHGGHPELVTLFSVLYAANMYFQSFGAVSIVKVNSAWFHLRERGTFGGIFGVLISLGLYFAFDWCKLILENAPVQWVFFIPAAILLVFAGLDSVFVKNTPGEAGHADFDLGDATSSDDSNGAPTPVFQVAKKMLSNPAILTIALIEFCSGYLRNSILQYYKPFAKDLGRVHTAAQIREAAAAGHALTSDFVHDHWGMLNCVAGILGGMVAGVISDRVFQSRRGPVSAVLYGVMIFGALLMFVTLSTPLIGWVVVLMSLAIIGVHGMLSGTASMDFGGKKNTGIAVGLIDGFVYLGVALEALVLKHVLPEDPALKRDPANWWTWPAAILPVAIIGFVLALRVWNAKPASKSAAAH